ncbi:MAG: hypothetical protein QXR62_03710 [Candidatus Bathyarchaeia archaeon]
MAVDVERSQSSESRTSPSFFGMTDIIEKLLWDDCEEVRAALAGNPRIFR